LPRLSKRGPALPTAEEAILQLVDARGVEKSICPSEAARLLAPNWQSRMKEVRAAAVRLALARKIDILRKGRVVENLDALRGVIRLRLRRDE
jgi:hypothetical protein